MPDDLYGTQSKHNYIFSQEKILAEAAAEEEQARKEAEEERRLKEEQQRLEEENRLREERVKAREGTINALKFGTLFSPQIKCR